MQPKTILFAAYDFAGLEAQLEKARLASIPNPDLTPGDWDKSGAFNMLSGAAYQRGKGWKDLRLQVFTRYGIPHDEGHRYMIDHLVPIVLGGTSTLANLWPHSVSAPFNPPLKSRVELSLRAMIKRGHIPLEDARNMLATDWTRAYLSFFGAAAVIGRIRTM